MREGLSGRPDASGDRGMHFLKGTSKFTRNFVRMIHSTLCTSGKRHDLLKLGFQA